MEREGGDREWAPKGEVKGPPVMSLRTDRRNGKIYMNFLDRDTPLHYRASVYMGKQDGINALWAFGPDSLAITNARLIGKRKLLGAIGVALLGVFLIGQSLEALMVGIWVKSYSTNFFSDITGRQRIFTVIDEICFNVLHM